jgi:hypothetical protein
MLEELTHYGELIAAGIDPDTAKQMLLYRRAQAEGIIAARVDNIIPVNFRHDPQRLPS